MSHSENFVGHTSVQEVFDVIWCGEATHKMSRTPRRPFSTVSYGFRSVGKISIARWLVRRLPSAKRQRRLLTNIRSLSNGATISPFVCLSGQKISRIDSNTFSWWKIVSRGRAWNIKLIFSSICCFSTSCPIWFSWWKRLSRRSTKRCNLSPPIRRFCVRQRNIRKSRGQFYNRSSTCGSSCSHWKNSDK